MKRLFFLIGFLLIPLSAHAETRALSPWVQAVLDRVDEGISLAQDLPEKSCNEETIQSEIRNNQSLIRSLVLPAVHREADIASLRESTVCFQSDKHLLELKIREVQKEMETALLPDYCMISTSKALRETYKFLITAYASFIRGGKNPAYADDLLRYRYAFHDRELRNSGTKDRVAVANSTAPLCPYTTDYGVHSLGFIPTAVGEGARVDDASPDIKSFGCDPTVLETIVDPPYSREAQALREFILSTDRLSRSLYTTVSTALFNLNNVIRILTGADPDTEPAEDTVAPEHAALTGCLKPFAPDFDTGDPVEINALLSAYPDYFEKHNLRKDDAGNYTYSPLPEETLPTGMLHLPVIDYFLSIPNASILTRSFTDVREYAGGIRPLPKYLTSTVFDSFLMAIMRTADTSIQLREISANIEREMGILESSSTDALERKQDASVPLESAVQSLISIVDTELPEKYIPELTFFLARSCVDGHCKETLDAVARRTFNPYCHPYVSGLYLQEDAAQRCYCDEAIERTDNTFWKRYCSRDFSDDMEKYDNIEATMIPACIEETAQRSER